MENSDIIGLVIVGVMGILLIVMSIFFACRESIFSNRRI